MIICFRRGFVNGIREVVRGFLEGGASERGREEKSARGRAAARPAGTGARSGEDEVVEIAHADEYAAESHEEECDAFVDRAHGRVDIHSRRIVARLHREGVALGGCPRHLDRAENEQHEAEEQHDYEDAELECVLFAFHI